MCQSDLVRGLFFWMHARASHAKSFNSFRKCIFIFISATPTNLDNLNSPLFKTPHRHIYHQRYHLRIPGTALEFSVCFISESVLDPLTHPLRTSLENIIISRLFG